MFKLIPRNKEEFNHSRINAHPIAIVQDEETQVLEYYTFPENIIYITGLLTLAEGRVY